MTVRISVCLCTFQRPQVFDTLLSIEQQQLPDNVELEISVADNDAQGSGQAAIARFQQQSTIPVQYEIQPQKNISFARNTTLKNATGEWVIFIDDDEIAAPDWVAQLWACAQSYQADAVLGRVIIHYPENTPTWILEGDYFQKYTAPTGTEVRVGSTCNALVRRRSLPDSPNSFDPNYGITGGGDTHLFNRLYRHGGKIVTCREAIVSETVEPERLNQDYLLRKATRIGETYAVIFFSALNPLSKIWQLSRATVQTLVAGALALCCGPFTHKHSFRYRLLMNTNWGKVRFFFNAPPVEIYK